MISTQNLCMIFYVELSVKEHIYGKIRKVLKKFKIEENNSKGLHQKLLIALLEHLIVLKNLLMIFRRVFISVRVKFKNIGVIVRYRY